MTGFKKLLMETTLLRSEQLSYLRPALSRVARSWEYDSTFEGDDLSSQCFLDERSMEREYSGTTVTRLQKISVIGTRQDFHV